MTCAKQPKLEASIHSPHPNASLAGYTLKRKFKGHQNRTTQIRASMGVPADFLVCGSDDGWVYVWDLAGSEKGLNAASKQVRSCLAKLV